MTNLKKKEQKMKNFFSRRARRVRREDPRRNKIQDHAGTFWNFSFPVSPVTNFYVSLGLESLPIFASASSAFSAASSEAGERKVFVFGRARRVRTK